MKTVLQNVAFMIVLGLLLFPPAGTFAWPQAWIFLALFDGCALILGLWLRKVDPDLLAERMKSPGGAGQKPQDRAVMIAIMVGFALWLVFMALDARRFGWSHVPLWAQALGAALIVIAFYAWTGVLRANSFATTRVRLQPERGQAVISTGPYAIVRHPMYADMMFLIFGVPLLLGSLWGLLGVVPLTALLVARLLGEEAMLIAGLPGYREYATKVRFRLLPGVW
ncbi:MAG: isoprenylcysteine carboxylmethyltransferase family protein [Acetobacteraceae bacterium]